MKTDSQIRIIYAREKYPDDDSKSIFLAGPLRRDSTTKSWRDEAVKLLQAEDYRGTVLSPDDRNPDHPALGQDEFRAQIEWEENCLNRADIILFWLPRYDDSYPDYATNTEWGVWQHSGKVVLGAPPDAKRVRYLLYYADKYSVPTADNLKGTVKDALSLLK